LRSMIREVLRTLPGRRDELLRRELDLLDRSIERIYLFLEDLTRARIADHEV